jgi:hypothetical protein
MVVELSANERNEENLTKKLDDLQTQISIQQEIIQGEDFKANEYRVTKVKTERKRSKKAQLYSVHSGAPEDIFPTRRLGRTVREGKDCYRLSTIELIIFDQASSKYKLC